RRQARVRASASTADGRACCAFLLVAVRDVAGTEPVGVRRIACRSSRADPSATARKLGSTPKTVTLPSPYFSTVSRAVPASDFALVAKPETNMWLGKDPTTRAAPGSSTRL